MIFGSAFAYATTWAPAVTRAFSSPDANVLFRIEPGTNRAQSDPFVPPFSEANSKAIHLQFAEETQSYEKVGEFILANAHAPDAVLVRNDGSLITIDNWGVTGGPAVAIYSGTGIPVVAYALRDLYPDPGVIERLRGGGVGAGIEWREGREIVFGDSLLIRDRIGNVFVFDLNDGTFRKEKSAVNPQ